MRMRKLTYGTIINLSILSIFVVFAIFSPFIANDRAILCTGEEGLTMPVFRQNPNQDCDPVINPLIRYRYNNIDQMNANFVGPFDAQRLATRQQKHFLGTDQLGRDVAAGLVHGSRIALLTGGLSMLIALVLGLFFGLLGGYYGNDVLRSRRSNILIFILLFTFLIYFLVYPQSIAYSFLSLILYFVIFLLLAAAIHFASYRIPYLKRKVRVPLDLMFSNFIEIFQSLPGSFIILILVSLFTKASIFNVILVIGILRWPMIARYVRAEMLKIKEQRYIEASRAIGLSDWRIIFKHALPATLTPVIVAVAFGFSSAILLESTLSFLGIGLPADHVSFGSMLSEARNNYEAWWMAVFPGLAIFVLVYVFNYLGDALSNRIDKK